MYSGRSHHSQSGLVKNPWQSFPVIFFPRSHLAMDEQWGCCGAELLGTLVLWDKYESGPSPYFSPESGAVSLLLVTGGVRVLVGAGLATCSSLLWAQNPDHALHVGVPVSLVQVSKSWFRLAHPLMCALSFRGRVTLAVVHTDLGTR